MASFDELTWKEYSDFTAGLYERGTDLSCPPNGLLSCQDCYPQVEGGLRASGVWKAMTTTNLPNDGYILAVEGIFGGGPAGLYVLVLIANAGGAGNHTFQLFILTGSVTGGSWTSLGTVTGFTSWWFGNRVSLYRTGASLTSGVTDIYMNLYGNTTKDGIYKSDGSTLAQAFAAKAPTDVIAYQSRLLYTQNVGPIWFTSAGVDTAPTSANGLFPYQEFGTNMRCMFPFSPSDLIVEKRAIGILDIQGDITAPTARQMTFKNHDNVLMYPAYTDQGLAYTMYEDGVYVYDGSNLNLISQPILGCPMQPNYFGSDDIIGLVPHAGEPSVSSLGFGVPGRSESYEYFLYAGQAYVWDTRTQAWFKITVPEASTSGTASHFTYYNTTPRQFIVHSRNLSMQTGRHPLWYMEANEGDLTRASSYSFTLPLIYIQGQRTSLRELEYEVDVQEANSTLSVSILDSTGTTTNMTAVTLAATGPQKVRVHVGLTSMEWYKVTTTLASATTKEAPILTKMYTGTADATRSVAGN